MPAFDFWDIDEILAEQVEVTARPWHDIAGGGMLMSTDTGKTPKDLKAGTKVQVPLWLAQNFVRRVTMEVEVPEIFGASALEDLQRDSMVCRVGDKSQYYFQVGVRVASLLNQPSIEQALFFGIAERWKQIVKGLSKMGVPRQQNSRLNPGESLFPQTLTALETDMRQGGLEAEGQIKRWVDRFAVYEIRASHIVEAPAKRLRTG